MSADTVAKLQQLVLDQEASLERAVSGLKAMEQALTAERERVDAAWLKTNLATEQAAAYRICVEEAGTNEYHLRDWIRDIKAELQAEREKAAYARHTTECQISRRGLKCTCGYDALVKPTTEAK